MWLRTRPATIEVKASHVSPISQPETIANLIVEAAGAGKRALPGVLSNGCIDVALVKFVYDIVKRLIDGAYFRFLGILILIRAGVGTLFFWLVEGRTFLQTPAYAVSTLYAFLGVGLFLIFVLETGKTMVQSYIKSPSSGCYGSRRASRDGSVARCGCSLPVREWDRCW
jgi:hypothetical protein